MEAISWHIAAPAIGAAFLASLVEVVEAFTIVLAVGTLRGWRPAILGTVAGVALLLMTVAALGPLLDRVPIHLLQFVIGLLLLFFGLRWLRKAILRAAGFIALHDEDVIFTMEQADLREKTSRSHAGADWIAGFAAFKAVVLEGLEVVFIVIAVGAAGGGGMIVAASIGAMAACVLVLLIGLFVHRPLARVPENTLKFVVGMMLSSFGVFWTGEALGVAWPGQDAAVPAIAIAFLAFSSLVIARLRRGKRELAS